MFFSGVLIAFWSTATLTDFGSHIANFLILSAITFDLCRDEGEAHSDERIVDILGFFAGRSEGEDQFEELTCLCIGEHIELFGEVGIKDKAFFSHIEPPS